MGQSVYAHLNNFERLFIANLKQKCRQKEVALKEIEANKQLIEESKEMEHVKDESVAEEEEEYEEECEDDAEIEDKNDNAQDMFDDDTRCVGSKRSVATTICRSRRRK